MEDKEALEKLNSGEYEEAYAYFKNKYHKTGDLLCKYYVAIIEFQYMEIPVEQLYDDFKQLLALPKNYRTSVLSPLVYICSELEKYEEVIKYANIAINNGDDNPFFCISLAKAYLVLRRNMKQIPHIIDSVLLDETISLELISVCLEILVSVRIDNKEYDLALKEVNEMYLKYGKQEFIDYEKIRVLGFIENSDAEIIETYERLLEGENKEKALANTFDYYYRKNKYDKVIECANILLERELTDKGKNMVFARKGMAHQALKEYEKAEECFLAMLDEEKYLHLGELYYDKGFLDGILKSIEYFNLYLKKDRNIVALGYLVECYNELGNLEKMYEYIMEIKKHDKKFMYLDLWLMDYYRRKGLFDKALKHIRLAYKGKVISAYQYNYYSAMVDKKPIKYYEFLAEMNLGMEDSAYFARRCASMLMHGEYGFDIDRKLALEKAKEAYSLEPCSCSRSILANYYLDNDEYSEEGSKRYFNHEDACPCIVAFYAYKLYNEGQKEEAFKILEKVVEDNGIKVSENIANLYAYISLELHKHTNEAYAFLKSFKERRYQISTTYVLIMLEEYLNIDTTKRKKEMLNCLLYSSKAELEYYTHEPKLPFMNNF